jgi:creatinine amidohydrolase
MTWKEVKQRLAEGYKTVVFGIGSTEQHGPSLPLRTDRKIADLMANMVTRELGDALQAPTIGVGFSAYHLNFAGTVSLRESTVRAIIRDYVDSLAHHGFENMVITNSHGGNNGPINQVLPELRKTYPLIKIIDFYDQETQMALGRLCQRFELEPGELGSHAGDMETSIMLYLDQDYVKTEEFVRGYTGMFDDQIRQKYRQEGFETLSAEGVAGDQRRATKKKGEAYINTLKEVMVAYIKKTLSE